MTSAYLYAEFSKNNQNYSLRFKIITMNERFYPTKRIHTFFRGDYVNKGQLAKRNFVKIGKNVNENELFRVLKWEIAEKYNIQPHIITLKWENKNYTK